MMMPSLIDQNKLRRDFDASTREVPSHGCTLDNLFNGSHEFMDIPSLGHDDHNSLLQSSSSSSSNMHGFHDYTPPSFSLSSNFYHREDSDLSLLGHSVSGNQSRFPAPERSRIPSYSAFVRVGKDVTGEQSHSHNQIDHACTPIFSAPETQNNNSSGQFKIPKAETPLPDNIDFKEEPDMEQCIPNVWSPSLSPKIDLPVIPHVPATKESDIPSSGNSTKRPLEGDDEATKERLIRAKGKDACDIEVAEGLSDGEDGDKSKAKRRIKIEFIDDKNRRLITFSKRKAGIMKKVSILF
jgi:hypothetical protein